MQIASFTCNNGIRVSSVSVSPRSVRPQSNIVLSILFERPVTVRHVSTLCLHSDLKHLEALLSPCAAHAARSSTGRRREEEVGAVAHGLIGLDVRVDLCCLPVGQRAGFDVLFVGVGGYYDNIGLDGAVLVREGVGEVGGDGCRCHSLTPRGQLFRFSLAQS